MYNIWKQLANIKAYSSLLDMVTVPEQQKHLNDFMDGKNPTVASLIEEQDD